jgi:hypothetical protein
MMAVLLGACPSFAPQWEELLAEWKDEPGGLPLYLALADLARHLIGMLERGGTRDFPAIFAAVERLVREGEPSVQNAAAVGLLEALQNRNLHTTTRPEQFWPFLGAESRQAWSDLCEAWGGAGGACP